MKRADYEAVLNDLERRRDAVDEAINALRQVRSVLLSPVVAFDNSWKCQYCHATLNLCDESEHTKRHVLELVIAGGKITRVAEMLGISYNRAYSYCQQAGGKKTLRRQQILTST